jgi:hypothetical protein
VLGYVQCGKAVGVLLAALPLMCLGLGALQGVRARRQRAKSSAALTLRRDHPAHIDPLGLPVGPVASYPLPDPSESCPPFSTGQVS